MFAKAIKILVIIALLSIIAENALLILNDIKMYEQIQEVDKLIYRTEKKINVAMSERS